MLAFAYACFRLCLLSLMLAFAYIYIFLKRVYNGND